MPESAVKILDQLKVGEDVRSFECLSADYALDANIEIDAPQGVFPRIMEEEKAA